MMIGGAQQAGHYSALDSDGWGSLFSEAVGIQIAASFFKMSLAHAKQSYVKNSANASSRVLPSAN
jgi:hypothetical protein